MSGGGTIGTPVSPGAPPQTPSTALALVDLAVLQGWLLEAEYAQHKLRTGAQEMQIDHGDMRVAYTKADGGKLQAYIDSLKAQIAALGGTIGGQRRRGMEVNL